MIMVGVSFPSEPKHARQKPLRDFFVLAVSLVGFAPQTPQRATTTGGDMARPRNPNARTAKVDLRLTTEEAARWRAEAEGLGVSLGEWIRARVECGKIEHPVQRIEVVADPETRRHLGAMGSNLNQLARAVNYAGFHPDDAARLLAYLAAMNEQLAEIREHLQTIATAEGMGRAT